MSKSDLVNAISAFAIVVGLVFVFIELRQSREIAEAQLWTQINGAMLSQNLAIVGEDGAAALAKQCHKPSELTPTDWEVLVAHRRALLRRSIDWYRMQDRNMWMELDPDQLTRNVALSYLGTPVGRYMWRSERDWVTRGYPRLAEIFDEVLSSIPKGKCLWEGQLEDYLSELSEGDL